MVRVIEATKAWSNNGGGVWTNGEHALALRLTMYVVTKGPFEGLVFSGLSEAMDTVNKLANAKAVLAALEAEQGPTAEDWADFGDWLAERWEAEKNDWFDGLAEEHSKNFPNAQDDVPSKLEEDTNTWMSNPNAEGMS